MQFLRSRKVQSSLVLAIVGLLAATAAMDGLVNLVGMEAINGKSGRYLERWKDQAVATAATAAVMNAGLSVMEDSEIELAPWGIGASLAFGDAVRPVNNMVSRVLSIALVSAVSLKIQQTLIEIGAVVGLRWFFALSMVFLLLTIWSDWPPLRRLAWGFFVLAVVARFLIPATVFLTGTIGDAFNQKAYLQTQSEFERLKSEAMKTKAQIEKTIPTGDDVLAAVNPFDGRQELPSYAGVRRQLSRLFGRLANMASAVYDLAITYAAVFIMQTILIPILILWALIKQEALADLRPAVLPDQVARQCQHASWRQLRHRGRACR